MDEMPKRRKKKKAALPTRRLVIYLPDEALQGLGIGSTMEKKSKRAWLTEAIKEKARRWVVHDRGDSREDEAAA